MTTSARVGPPPVGGGPTPYLPAHAQERPVTALTDNELTVLRRASEGCTYAAIAEEMVMAEKSISKIALRLARKLGARNITQSVYLACQAGILDGRPRRHGDHPGFAAHQYRGEEPCEACWVGEREYRAEQRARRAAKVDAA